ERALALVPSDGRSACELLIGLGEARIRAGAMQQGQELCVRAAEIARALPEPRLLARAALVYGTELLGGRVDPQMVSLLRDALAAVGGDAPALRARLLSRLGSALVPSSPENHIEAEGMAREALAIADRKSTRLNSSHLGISYAVLW